MNLLLFTGFLFAVLSVQFVQGDDTIHFPKDESEDRRTTSTIAPVRRTSACAPSTVKKENYVYDSNTVPKALNVSLSDGSDCSEEENEQQQEIDGDAEIGSVDEIMPSAPARVTPPTCRNINVWVYDSDTDSWVPKTLNVPSSDGSDCSEEEEDEQQQQEIDADAEIGSVDEIMPSVPARFACKNRFVWVYDPDMDRTVRKCL